MFVAVSFLCSATIVLTHSGTCNLIVVNSAEVCNWFYMCVCCLHRQWNCRLDVCSNRTSWKAGHWPAQRDADEVILLFTLFNAAQGNKLEMKIHCSKLLLLFSSGFWFSVCRFDWLAYHLQRYMMSWLLDSSQNFRNSFVNISSVNFST